jgi:hypothetical protein
MPTTRHNQPCFTDLDLASNTIQIAKMTQHAITSAE